MRVSIAIEIADGPWPLLPDRRSTAYAKPLATFVAQLAGVYLQTPTTWALKRRAHADAIAGYQLSSPGDVVQFDRSV